jgi:hypothetical protein
MRYLEEKFLAKTYFDNLAYQNMTRRLSFPSLQCADPRNLPRYRAIKAPFSRQISFAGASRVMRVLGKKTTRAKESLLSKLGMIRARPGMAPRPAMMRQQSAWVERPLEEVQEGEEEEEERDTRQKYRQQKSCHF